MGRFAYYSSSLKELGIMCTMLMMPLLEELKLVEDFSNLSNLLKENSIGSRPFYIDALNLDYQKIDFLVKKIEEHLNEKNLDGLIPYPLFLITKKINNHDKISIVESKRAIPSHFIEEAGRLTRKEQKILEKINLFSDRILSLELKDKRLLLSKIFKGQRELHTLCSEIDFCELILQKTKEEERNVRNL